MSEPADGLKKLNEYLESVQLRNSHLNGEEANGVRRLVEVLAYCGPIYRAHDPETEFIKNLIEVCPQCDASTIKTLAIKISPLFEVVKTEITKKVTGLNDSLSEKNSNETKTPKTQLCNHLSLMNIWRRLQWIAKQVDIKSDETNQGNNVSEIIGLKSVIDILSEGLRKYYTHIANCEISSKFKKKNARVELSSLQWYDSHKETKRVPSTKPPNKKPKIK